QQAEQTYQQYLTKPNDLEKRHFLMEIFNTNRTLFYYLFNQHIVEFNPIVYDPTIADTIENYSHLFVDTQYAAYLDINHPENIKVTLENAAGDRKIRLIVVTDAEGILGIGDWGTQGVDISVGKLMIYTAAAGIDPECVLPIVIDAGTTRQELLNDPLYLGNHQERQYGDDYYDFIDQFVNTAEDMFPKLYLHWEDFGRSNAATILNKYKNVIPTFNDDIQGTGIVVLGGIFGSLDITGEKLTDQVYLCYGGGSAGAGISNRVHAEMVSEGLSEEEAYKRFFMVDKQGLLFDDMTDLTPAQKPFAKKRSDFANADDMTDLLTIIKTVKPTILVGTSTDPGAFTKAVVEAMCANTARPIIFPISNPTKKLEATAQQVIEWSDGKAFVATGVPSDTITYKGVDYQIGQANNALIYPGLGLGMLASEASLLTDEMIGAAAHSLSGLVDLTQAGAPVLPPFQYVADVSIKVAEAVANMAKSQGLAQAKETDMSKAVKNLKWYPEY
ncbi:MAG: NAD-dependent malic enzyme, partial [Lactococcus sp.]|nr:NAD-dependent malic enzyme [Lactococcus sp.]